jgi:hypothetical protein
MKTLKTAIQSVQKTAKITNNTQRAGLRLLSFDGQWIPRSQLRHIPSATARVRDLRKATFGSFDVECKSSSELSKKLGKKTYYYRISPSKVTSQQLKTLFKV